MVENPDINMVVFGMIGKVKEPGFLISLGYSHLDNSHTHVQKLAEVTQFF
jgi:hypothetical protein